MKRPMIISLITIVHASELTCTDLKSLYQSVSPDGNTCCDGRVSFGDLTCTQEKPILRKDINIGLRTELNNDGQEVQVQRTYSMLASNEEGKGSAIVFVPGFPSSADLYRDVMNEMVKLGDHRCYSIDLFGMAIGARPATGIVLEDVAPNATYPIGLAPKQDNRIVSVKNYKWKNYGADVQAVMQSIGEPSYYLVGHDWGGPAAGAVLRHNPSVIKGVGMINTFLGEGGNKAFADGFVEFKKLVTGQSNSFDQAGQFAVSSSYMPQMCKGNAYAETAPLFSTNPAFINPNATMGALWMIQAATPAFQTGLETVKGATARLNHPRVTSSVMSYYRANICGNEYNESSFLPNPAYDFWNSPANPYLGAIMQFGENALAAYQHEVAQGWYDENGMFDNGEKFSTPLYMFKHPADIYIQDATLEASMKKFTGVVKTDVYAGDVYTDPTIAAAYVTALQGGGGHWITPQKATAFATGMQNFIKEL